MARSPRQPGHERLELRFRYRRQMLLLRIGPGLDVGAEFLERRDPLLLQSVIFGAKIAVDLGVARLVAAGVAEHVLGEQILRVAAQ
jgi:hypothetical protein